VQDNQSQLKGMRKKLNGLKAAGEGIMDKNSGWG
jgi:hypothetical protein